MKLAPKFVQRIGVTFAPDGERWLTQLPDILDTFAARWGLRVEPPFEGLSYNYVTPAVRADGSPAVLKLGVPRDELGTEIDALRHYGGRGCCRLLEADEEAGALLLERLLPGQTLGALAADDDEAATRIAADVMARLWAPPPPGHRYPNVADWASGLLELRPHFGGGTGPFPAALVDRALGLFAELLPSQEAPVVLHGDLHHFNILAAGGGWLAIDPKGVVGEPAYEVGAFLRNPLPAIGGDPQLARTLERRIAIFAEALGLDRRRIQGWALAQAVLSAWWSYDEESGSSSSGGPAAVAVAAALATLRP